MSTSPKNIHPGFALEQAKETWQKLTLESRVRIRLLPALVLLQQATTAAPQDTEQRLIREAWTHAAAARQFANAHTAGDALEGLCCYYLGVAQWHLGRGAPPGPVLNLFARAEAAGGEFPEGDRAVEWPAYISERDAADGSASYGRRPSSSRSWVESIASSVYALFSPPHDQKVEIRGPSSPTPATRPPGRQRQRQRPRTSDGQSARRANASKRSSPPRPRTADADTLGIPRDTIDCFGSKGTETSSTAAAAADNRPQPRNHASTSTASTPKQPEIPLEKHHQAAAPSNHPSQNPSSTSLTFPPHSRTSSITFSPGTPQPNNNNNNSSSSSSNNVDEGIYRQDHHRRRTSLNRLFIRTSERRSPEALAEEGESPTFSQQREGGKEGEGNREWE